MGKIDIMFHEIISSDKLVNEYGYNPDKYESISQGCKSENKYVRTIANMLLALDKNIESQKMDMRIRNKTGKVVLSQSVWDSIYRKLVKDLGNDNH